MINLHLKFCLRPVLSKRNFLSYIQVNFCVEFYLVNSHKFNWALNVGEEKNPTFFSSETLTSLGQIKCAVPKLLKTHCSHFVSSSTGIQEITHWNFKMAKTEFPFAHSLEYSFLDSGCPCADGSLSLGIPLLAHTQGLRGRGLSLHRRCGRGYPHALECWFHGAGDPI